MPRSTTMTVAAFAAAAACALAAPAASQVVSSGGEVVSAAQKHIVDNLLTIDSIQAATAKLAATKTQNPDIREFANSLASEHSAHVGSLAKIADKKDVGRERDPEDKLAAEFAARAAALETTAAGPEFDRAFLQAVVANHQAELTAIDTWKASAKDEDLKKDLEHTTSGLKTHLSKANELTSKMDKPSKPPF